MMELYKGNAILDKIMTEMPYKQALLLRDVRSERLERERKEIERQRKEEESKQFKERVMKK